jgi:SAM-dependent methyltransferase
VDASDSNIELDDRGGESMVTGLASTTERERSATATHLGRLSGLSLAMGGALATGAWVLHGVLDPARGGYAEPWWIPLNLALSCGAILMALGLPGAHARQASRAGVLGTIGLVMLFGGLLLAYVGVQILEAFSRPQVPSSIGMLAGIAAPIFFLGIVFTSVATWRAEVYPRAVAIALAATAMLGLLTRLVTMPAWLGMNIVPAFFTAAMGWWGLPFHARHPRAHRNTAPMNPWWESFFRGPWEQIQLPGYPEERTRNEVSFMEEALRLSSGDRILDVPCGEGRHSIELARRGYRPTAVDFNPNAVAVARQRSSDAGVDVDLSCADMRQLDRLDEFDAAICFFGSFGYFEDEDNADFARRVARALRPEGRFLIDTHVTESLYSKFRERDWSWVQEEPQRRVLEERKLDLESGRIEATWTFLDSGGSTSNSLSIRLYSYRELRDLLLGAGFASIEAFETGRLEPFRLGSSRISVVATKPA